MNDIKNIKDYKGNELPVVNVKLTSNFSLYSEAFVSDADEAVQLIGEQLYGLSKEHVCVICCNESYMPLCVGLISIGNEKQAFFKMKDIIQIGILSNATYLIVMHNHPSRYKKDVRMNMKPSPNDIEFTDLLMKACELMGLTLHDSIIIGDAYDNKKHMPVYYSIREDKIKLIRKKNLSDVAKTHSLQQVTSNQNHLDWDNKTGRLSSYWNSTTNKTEDKHIEDESIYICFTPSELESLLAFETAPEFLKEKVEREQFILSRITNTKYRNNVSFITRIKYLAKICQSQEEFDIILQQIDSPQLGFVIDKMLGCNMTIKEIENALPKYRNNNKLLEDELVGTGSIYKRR